MWMLCSDGNKHSKCLLPRIPEICKPRFSGTLCLYVCRSDPRFIPPYFMREKSISYLISPHIWSLPNQNKSFILIQTSSYFFKHFTRFFYKKHFYEKMSLKNLKNLRKMLRKSPASDVWATIFKNTDFSKSSLKVTKLSKF